MMYVDIYADSRHAILQNAAILMALGGGLLALEIQLAQPGAAFVPSVVDTQQPSRVERRPSS